MPEPVKTRAYDARRRRAAAEQNRRSVLLAARDLFRAGGYSGTTVAAVARRAGVSVDTVYAAVGRKPQLLVAVHDMELAGGVDPLPAEERDYVLAIRAATTAESKLRIYADALAKVLPRSVPILEALREAGAADPECARAWEEVRERRATNMLLLARDLRATGELREDLDDRAVADVVWSMNGPEYYGLLASRGLTPAAYADLLYDVWSRVLLAGR